MDGNILQAAVPPAIAVVLLCLGLRTVTARHLARFGERFGIGFDDQDREFVAPRLRRSRAMRSTAAAAGVLVTGLPAYMNLIDANRSSDFAIAPVANAWLFSAAIAAVAAEVLLVQRPARKGEAALVERRPEHYVSPRWPRIAMALSAAAVAAFIVGVVGAYDGLLEASTGVVGAVIALVAVTFGLRRVADRPRLDTTGHLREIDDALRSYGAHHVVGAAVALSAMSLSLASQPLFNDVAPVLNLVVGLFGTASLGVWHSLARNEPWRVPQPAGVIG